MPSSSASTPGGENLIPPSYAGRSSLLPERMGGDCERRGAAGPAPEPEDPPRRALACYVVPVRLDFLDFCLLLFGIIFTIAKLDAQGREAENFPHVPRADFERWQRLTVSIYRTGSIFCFARALFHFPWSYLVAKYASGPAAPASWRLVALVVDLVCLLVLAATFIRARRARALRTELGIVLSPLSAAEQRVYEKGTPENEAPDSAK